MGVEKVQDVRVSDVEGMWDAWCRDLKKMTDLSCFTMRKKVIRITSMMCLVSGWMKWLIIIEEE